MSLKGETGPWTTLDAELLTAVSKGDGRKVRTLVDKKRVDATRISPTTGDTAFHRAVAEEKLEIFRILVTASPPTDINIRDRRGRTLLHVAAYYGREKILNQLLQLNGAACTVLDADGANALHIACSRGHMGCVVQLLNSTHTQDYNLVHATDTTGRTALFCAATRGSSSICKLLLEAGADINARDDRNRTALMLSTGHSPTFQYLLDKGSDLHATDNQGHDALWEARTNKHEETIKLIADIECSTPSSTRQRGERKVSPSSLGRYNGYIERQQLQQQQQTQLPMPCHRSSKTAKPSSQLDKDKSKTIQDLSSLNNEREWQLNNGDEYNDYHDDVDSTPLSKELRKELNNLRHGYGEQLRQGLYPVRQSRISDESSLGYAEDGDDVQMLRERLGATENRLRLTERALRETDGKLNEERERSTNERKMDEERYIFELEKERERFRNEINAEQEKNKSELNALLQARHPPELSEENERLKIELESAHRSLRTISQECEDECLDLKKRIKELEGRFQKEKLANEVSSAKYLEATAAHKLNEDRMRKRIEDLERENGVLRAEINRLKQLLNIAAPTRDFIFDVGEGRPTTPRTSGAALDQVDTSPQAPQTVVCEDCGERVIIKRTLHLCVDCSRMEDHEQLTSNISLTEKNPVPKATQQGLRRESTVSMHVTVCERCGEEIEVEETTNLCENCCKRDGQRLHPRHLPDKNDRKEKESVAFLNSSLPAGSKERQTDSAAAKELQLGRDLTENDVKSDVNRGAKSDDTKHDEFGRWLEENTDLKTTGSHDIVKTLMSNQEGGRSEEKRRYDKEKGLYKTKFTSSSSSSSTEDTSTDVSVNGSLPAKQKHKPDRNNNDSRNTEHIHKDHKRRESPNAEQRIKRKDERDKKKRHINGTRHQRRSESCSSDEVESRSPPSREHKSYPSPSYVQDLESQVDQLNEQLNAMRRRIGSINNQPGDIRGDASLSKRNIVDDSVPFQTANVLNTQRMDSMGTTLQPGALGRNYSTDMVIAENDALKAELERVTRLLHKFCIDTSRDNLDEENTEEGKRSMDERLNNLSKLLDHTQRLLETEKDKFDRTISDLRSNLAGLEDEKGRHQDEIARLQRDVVHLTDSRSEFEKRVDKLASYTKSLEEEKQRFVEEISELRADTKELIEERSKFEENMRLLHDEMKSMEAEKLAYQQEIKKLYDDINEMRRQQGMEGPDLVQEEGEALEKRIAGLVMSQSADKHDERFGVRYNDRYMLHDRRNENPKDSTDGSMFMEVRPSSVVMLKETPDTDHPCLPDNQVDENNKEKWSNEIGSNGTRYKPDLNDVAKINVPDTKRSRRHDAVVGRVPDNETDKVERLRKSFEERLETERHEFERRQRDLRDAVDKLTAEKNELEMKTRELEATRPVVRDAKAERLRREMQRAIENLESADEFDFPILANEQQQASNVTPSFGQASSAPTRVDLGPSNVGQIFECEASVPRRVDHVDVESQTDEEEGGGHHRATDRLGSSRDHVDVESQTDEETGSDHVRVKRVDVDAQTDRVVIVDGEFNDAHELAADGHFNNIADVFSAPGSRTLIPQSDSSTASNRGGRREGIAASDVIKRKRLLPQPTLEASSQTEEKLNQEVFTPGLMPHLSPALTRVARDMTSAVRVALASLEAESQTDDDTSSWIRERWNEKRGRKGSREPRDAGEVEDEVVEGDEEVGEEGERLNKRRQENAELQAEIQEREKQYRTVIGTYRSHLLAAIHGCLDNEVKNVLMRIACAR